VVYWLAYQPSNQQVLASIQPFAYNIKIKKKTNNQLPEEGSKANTQNIMYIKYTSAMDNMQHNVHIMNQPLSHTFTEPK
jgi:hypothetical protein